MSSFYELKCPKCGGAVKAYSNPFPTVDAIIYEPDRGIVLIDRKFEPLGWALPGGFVDYGESVEQAAIREAMEETNLPVHLRELLGVYSDPARDARRHTISTVFIASTDVPEALRGGDDAAKAAFFSLESLPTELAFDHARILEDFRRRHAAAYGV